MASRDSCEASLKKKVNPDRDLASRLSLGGKQKREQPARRRHRLIRIVGIDARKCRDPAREATHGD